MYVKHREVLQLGDLKGIPGSYGGLWVKAIENYLDSIGVIKMDSDVVERCLQRIQQVEGIVMLIGDCEQQLVDNSFCHLRDMWLGNQGANQGKNLETP